MKKSMFPKDFIWGISSSAYQIEGAYDEDGKGESIWDRWSHIHSLTEGMDTGASASDHYHKCEEDINLLKSLGVKCYRFSIAWTRIFPDGFGTPNENGLKFYKKLIKQLNENGITPAVTLFHWDLPQKLQDAGGWTNPKIVCYFEAYARCLFKEFGESVPIWITINEPWAIAFGGYFYGDMPPGIRDFSAALQAAHHLMMAHGKAVRAFRKMGLVGKIGIALGMWRSIPDNDHREDVEAVQREHGSSHLWFSDPLLRGTYPEYMLNWYSDSGVKLPEIRPVDLELIRTPIDFLGVNYYHSNVIGSDPGKHWPLEYKVTKYAGYERLHPLTIKHEGLYETLISLSHRYNDVPLMITENGFSDADFINSRDEVEDDERIEFLYSHINQAKRAIEDGVNLQGYFVWCFLDGYEWGKYHRMGLVYVDYSNQRRKIKKSGKWYSEVIEKSGLGDKYNKI